MSALILLSCVILVLETAVANLSAFMLDLEEVKDELKDDEDFEEDVFETEELWDDDDFGKDVCEAGCTGFGRNCWVSVAVVGRPCPATSPVL